MTRPTAIAPASSGIRYHSSFTPHPISILMIEEECATARLLELELRYRGYQVYLLKDGVAGLSVAQEFQADLVLLGWSLPNLSGLEICRRLRGKGHTVPIILLADANQVPGCVAGLDAGADDYLVKPFSLDELLARIRARLRRSQLQCPDVLKFADLTVNRKTRHVHRGTRAIELTAKEFDLLDYLVSNSQRVLTRNQILENVWGYDFMGDSNVIEVYIRYLRIKLELNQESRLIHTIRGVGYVLREPDR